ncbi:sterol desaturase family protein [Xenorhabdus innexi]|uniref:Putative fatty acid hydroxylase n=1 Tax=Xenorhabdus innexi TaxID=290109 RepID=A0A1N6MZL0_9GAMM|nr:sterol desaturase family protein [Xenorhabdus innexi]PHM37897.1 hypothetical protein Xinn_00706 [Xenorhabdus innexi]SIP74271.1 putative fatty acid hydroxylase [Xenorhabdus innexi]
MNWNLTRSQYMADFIIVPVYAFAAFAMSLISGDINIFWLLYAGLGWLIWTLMEYTIHRFGFHFYYKRDHARHHVKPLDWIGTTPIFITISLGLAWLISCTLMDSFTRGSMIFIGLCIGYYYYISIHYLIHHSSTSVIDKLRRHHEIHHRNPHVNYGVSVRIWDFVLRTIKISKYND